MLKYRFQQIETNTSEKEERLREMLTIIYEKIVMATSGILSLYPKHWIYNCVKIGLVHKQMSGYLKMLLNPKNLTIDTLSEVLVLIRQGKYQRIIGEETLTDAQCKRHLWTSGYSIRKRKKK